MQKSLLRALMIFAFAVSVNFSQGQNWEKIFSGYNYILTALEFPDNQSQIGYSAGQSSTWNGNGIVLKTTDGGDTWESLWTGNQQGIEGMSFPTLDTGYVAGWNGIFAKTTDGGASWQTMEVASDVYYYADVVFKDAWNGVLLAFLNSGPDDLLAFSTNDGGQTWSEGFPLPSIPLSACHVRGDTYFLACWGRLLKSTDNGLSWEVKFTAAGMPLAGVRFKDESIGMAASEDGVILKTFDGGENWEMMQIADGYPLWRDFAWADQNTVYVSGTPEVIWKSTDGGANWENDYLESTWDNAIYEIQCLEDGTIISAGSQGYVFRKKPAYYSVSFVVKDEEQNDINDAVIVFNGQEYQAGFYSFEVVAGTYDYEISKEGYISVLGQVVVENEDMEVGIVMQIDNPNPTWVVSFIVKDQEQNEINDAVVVFDGQEYQAGHYSFEVAAGTYDYQISKEGYFPASGQAIVENGDVELTVVMQMDDTRLSEFTAGQLKVFPNPARNLIEIHTSEMMSKVQILDLRGQLLISESVNAGSLSLKLDMLSNGSYFVKVFTEKGIQTKQILVIR